MLARVFGVCAGFLLLATTVADLPSGPGSDGNTLCQCNPALSCGRDDAGQIGEKLDGIKSVMEKGLGVQKNCTSELANLQRRLQVLQEKVTALESTAQRAIIKQWVWNSLNLDTDIGTIKTVAFNKERSSTRLKISWYGSLRVLKRDNSAKCQRWYFTFNGQECQIPAKIDGVVLVDRDVNIHRTATIEGICENIPAGAVAIGFHVGACGDVSTADAYTCRSSMCKIECQEIP